MILIIMSQMIIMVKILQLASNERKFDMDNFDYAS